MTACVFTFGAVTSQEATSKGDRNRHPVRLQIHLERYVTVVVEKERITGKNNHTVSGPR
ncbi:hypothetical protein KCP76_24685 [Salmonella enterica subsp. enterica serovar Weltevreden]|nr:hypothetical protein KCP76_24685 [Salmonella enterica subsp. enterica serovar Weltevreden]